MNVELTNTTTNPGGADEYHETLALVILTHLSARGLYDFRHAEEAGGLDTIAGALAGMLARAVGALTDDQRASIGGMI